MSGVAVSLLFFSTVGFLAVAVERESAECGSEAQLPNFGNLVARATLLPAPLRADVARILDAANDHPAVKAVASLPDHVASLAPSGVAVPPLEGPSAAQIAARVPQFPVHRDALDAADVARVDPEADAAQRQQPVQTEPSKLLDLWADRHEKERLRFKVAVIGDNDAEKIAMLRHYQHRSKINFDSKFARLLDDPNRTTTDGWLEIVRDDVTAEGDDVRLKIWDITADRRYRFVVNGLLFGIDGFALVYDCAGQKGLEGVQEWLSKVQESQASKPAYAYAKKGAPVGMLVASKVDDSSCPGLAEAEEFARDNSLLFARASLATGEGVREAFSKLAAEMVARTRPPVEPGLHMFVNGHGHRDIPEGTEKWAPVD